MRKSLLPKLIKKDGTATAFLIAQIFSCSNPNTTESISNPELPSENIIKTDIIGKGNFGDVYLGEQVSQVFEIKNKADYELTKMEFPLLVAPFSITASTCLNTFAPMSTCTLTIAFAPTEVDQFSSVASLTYWDKALKVTRTIDLSGNGISTGILVPAEPTTDLGLQVRNIPLVQAIDFVFSGTEQISEVKLDFDQHQSFVGSIFPGTKGTCSDLITSNCSMEFVLDFSSFSLGAISDTLIFGYNNGKNIVTGSEVKLNVLLADSTRTSANEKSQSGLSSFSRVLILQDNAWALDTRANRVLRWDGIPTVFTASTLVLGQPDAYSRSANRGSSTALAATLNAPQDMASDGTRLAIADTGNNRVLIWNKLPTSSYTPADLVLGQTDFESNLINQGTSTLTGLHLNRPRAVAFISGRLVVSDTGNNRILVWNATPTQNNQEADLVLGQFDFSLGEANQGQTTPSASSLNAPTSISATTEQLFIIDQGNHRVMVFSLWPSANGQEAAFVLGQSTFQDSSVSQIPDDSNFNSPCDLVVASDRIMISDSHWHRLLGFHLPIVANKTAASLITGQPDAVTVLPGTQLSQLYSPCQLYYSGEKLYISEQLNLRISIWPGVEAVSADSSLNQIDGSTIRYFEQATSARTLLDPTIQLANGKLIITDSGLNRILIWNEPSKLLSGDPDAMIGQIDLSSFAPDLGPFSLNHPRSSYMDGSRFIAVDQGNNRLLVFEGIDDLGQVDADEVIGQANFLTKIAGKELNQLDQPSSVCLTTNHAYVADTGNNRVLRFVLPLVTGMSADLVFGVNRASSKVQKSLPEQSLLKSPGYVDCSDDYLLLTDTGNNRVVYWSPLPDTADVLPTLVLKEWESLPSESLGKASNLSNPSQAFLRNNAIYVVDKGHNRVLQWTTIPVRSVVPDRIFGQSNNLVPLRNDSLQGPDSIVLTSDDSLYVAESWQQRILKLPAAVITSVVAP